MKYKKLIDFLHQEVNDLFVMNCSSSFIASDEMLDIIHIGMFSETDLNLGIIYLKKDTNNNHLIIDGKKRIVSLLLFLKALKFDTNDIFKTIIPKLKLFGFEKTVYEKIINNIPLSYNEKQTYLYKEYEYFVDKMKNSNYTKDKIVSVLNRLTVSVVNAASSPDRDIFYYTNKNIRELNQIMLIKSYLAEINKQDLVDKLLELFNFDHTIIKSFFKAYLSPKFNCLIGNDNTIYEYFTKYIGTVSKYQSIDSIIDSILSSAYIYKKMYFAEFTDVEIRNAFIQIITNNGKDTFLYLLELCEDYIHNYLSKEILLEVCNIIITYTNERNNRTSFSDANFNFSKMTEELNQLIYNQQIEKK